MKNYTTKLFQKTWQSCYSTFLNDLWSCRPLVDIVGNYNNIETKLDFVRSLIASGFDYQITFSRPNDCVLAPAPPLKTTIILYTMQTQKVFVCITTSPLNSRCVENTALMSPTELAVALALQDIFTSWLLLCEKSSMCSFVVFVQNRCKKKMLRTPLSNISRIFILLYFDAFILRANRKFN